MSAPRRCRGSLRAWPRRTWDERLTALAHGIRDTARRHPAVFPLVLTRPAVTAAARAVRDSVQAALRDEGLPAPSIARAERLISTAVLDADFAELLRWLRLALESA